MALLSGIGSWYASTDQASKHAEAVKWEAKDANYVVRSKLDSVCVLLGETRSHVRVIERQLGSVRRLQAVNLTPLGPPVPEHKGVFRRILGFLTAPNGG